MLPTYWYILHILWLRFPYIFLSYWYILSCLAVPIRADLAAWYLLLEITIIVVLSFQMTNMVLDTRDKNQPSTMTRVIFGT